MDFSSKNDGFKEFSKTTKDIDIICNCFENIQNLYIFSNKKDELDWWVKHLDDFKWKKTQKNLIIGSDTKELNKIEKWIKNKIKETKKEMKWTQDRR